jgi:MSHA biogenesis protein MshI
VQLLKKLIKKTSVSPGIVAVSFLSNGFALAVTDYKEKNRPRLLHCEFVMAEDQQIQPQLELLVKQHRLEEYDCHILLSQDQYRSISMETPGVNNDEIKQALRWRIADMIDYPVDQAIIDYYPMPRSNRANTQMMLEVVAAQEQTLSVLCKQCKQVGLKVKVIDIQESALRNLATLLVENEQGIAILHLQKETGRIIIQKQGEIYLSRKISTGYQLLDDEGLNQSTELLTMEQDNLALEIQRSFDYVENFFDVPPINGLAAVLMPINSHSIFNFLNKTHGITARAIDISAIMDGDCIMTDATQNICAPVIGASLRRYLEANPI